MYSPHKKCYEGYETLMGSVRRVVMGRFKREGKKNKTGGLGPTPASKKYLEIKGEKGECRGEGGAV